MGFSLGGLGLSGYDNGPPPPLVGWGVGSHDILASVKIITLSVPSHIHSTIHTYLLTTVSIFCISHYRVYGVPKLVVAVYYAIVGICANSIIY